MNPKSEHGKHLFMAAFGHADNRAHHLQKAMETGSRFDLWRLSKGFDPRYADNVEVRSKAHQALQRLPPLQTDEFLAKQ